jgi:hypothetical protein
MRSARALLLLAAGMVISVPATAVAQAEELAPPEPINLGSEVIALGTEKGVPTLMHRGAWSLGRLMAVRPRFQFWIAGTIHKRMPR